MRNWLAVLAAAAFAPGCYGSNPAFTCTLDSQCTEGPSPTCQASTGRCSYKTDDDGCDAAGHYGSTAGGLSGKCVDDSSNNDVDAGSNSGSDDAGGTPIDAAPETFCYGSPTSLVKVCLAAAPTTPFKVEGNTKVLDTSDMTMCTTTLSGATDYCVVAATDITINSTLRATGPKPLVLIATGSITAGPVSLLDVSSHRAMGNSVLGAGHDPTSCTAGTPPSARGGGAGGSFTGKGGVGGDGTAAASGGKPGDVVAAVNALRGGCSGQDGDSNPGSAGHGGGAIFLIAGVKINFNGAINAGGEGGQGGPAAKGGGGGGGAGGMVGFDAPMIKVTNGVIANGGGGGEGTSQFGNAGQDGGDSGGIGPAAGGSSSTSGGDGGNGSSGAAAGPGDPGKNNNGGDAGGGGGGGGAGIIKAPATADLGDKASPPQTP